ncbi:MAG: DUF6513 domain-containing protein [Gemmataceae bacterium]|nr:DUF6513 domain-containing protein [Gemmataceae bacterium]
MDPAPPRIVFVTGRLAESALRRTLAEMGPSCRFQAEIVVLPISVAALLTTDWIARHWQPPADAQRIILPGLVRGDLDRIAHPHVERGPADLRDLPEYLSGKPSARVDTESYDIEIIAEINHASQLGIEELLSQARQLREQGADVIDLGCDPGGPWSGVGDAVRALRAEGYRVSIDSFDPAEVREALAAGAELVLSVNTSNLELAREWAEQWNAEVVAIPDAPQDMDSLHRTIECLSRHKIRFRIDPILEPIGMGFAASLGRYLDARRRYPETDFMMGVGNLTELTDADSAGINVLLLGFCQELGIRSVLTTEVANWCRTCVRELDLARRLVHFSIRHRLPPKRLDPNLILLRDPKVRPLSHSALRELADSLTDPNYRIFISHDELHIMNRSIFVSGTDPFALFRQVCETDSRMTPSHAFYLGYEMAKAITALTLGKEYRQDQPLRWGFLTRPENSHPPGSQSDG